MKKLLSVKFLVLLFLGIVLLLFLFFCWWYGVFSDVGKTITTPYDLDSIELIDGDQILSPEEYNGDEYSDLKQQIPKMTTKALVETYYEATRWGSDYSTTYPFCNNLELILTEGNPAIQRIAAELLKRKNAGRILMKTYQEMPVLRISYNSPDLWPNKVAFDYLELLLAQEEIQNHLLPWEKTELQELADQKQAEKFSEEEYPLMYAKQNYLYTDTYGYLHPELYGKDEIYYWQWSEEKLEERAKPFLHLREETDDE